MSVIGNRMRELRGSSSQREMADAIGIKYNAWARYEAGDVLPGADIISRICRIHACSADWLLGLPERGGSQKIAASGPGSMAAGRDINNGGDCSRCKLMQAHIKEITGRG